ncbi:MAG: hypothetical protein KF819_24075 [Labilithrix sp.]|nr:hypothetical protein [Labilithrix sp.]
MLSRKRVWWTLGIAGGACALVAVLHLPIGRSVLASAGGCPVGAGNEKAPSAEQLEALRAKAAGTALKGSRKAAARPAYGFELDRSTRADVDAWAKSGGHACTEELQGAALRCEGIGRGSGTVKDAYFRFDTTKSAGTGGGILVGIDLMHEGASPDQAAALFDSLSGAITREAGPPSAVQGQASAAHLGEGYLSRAASEYRFLDYAADVSATNYGEQGIVVRQQYRSVPHS